MMKTFVAFAFLIAFVAAAPQSTVDENKSKFDKTVNQASPPVDLSKPPVALPESTPIHEQPQELAGAHSHHEHKLLVSDAEWEAFKTKYEKKYKSAEEEKARRETYAERKVYIDAHNKSFAKGEETFTVEINKFADSLPGDKHHNGIIRPSKKDKAVEDE